MKIQPQQKPTTKRLILRFLMKLLFIQDHYANYIPLMTETKGNRVYRLTNDKSCNFETNEFQLINQLKKLICTKMPIFHPTQFIMLIWYWLVFTAIMYYFVQIGVVLTYPPIWQEQITSILYLSLDVITIIIFVMDIVVCFNCGYLFRGMIIMDRKRIVDQYIRYFLLADVISLLVLIVCPLTGIYELNYAKLWLINKLGRLSQIDNYFLRKFNIYRRTKTTYVILKLAVIIFLLSHVVGLIFYLIDYNLCVTNKYYDQEFCWLYYATSFNGIIYQSYSQQYLYTLYWGLNTITTVSYGDIPLANPVEVVYGLFFFCFGFFVYAYVVNQIVKTILWAWQHEEELQNELIIMDTYMHNMNISKSTRKEIHDNLYFLYKSQKNRDLKLQENMLQKIPEELRIKLLENAYMDFYNRMMGIFESEQIIRIFFYLTQKKFMRHEPVFQQGDYVNSIFYLSKGRMLFQIKHGTRRTSIYQTFTQSQLIGHYELFSQSSWDYTATTVVSSLIYSIDRSKLMEQVDSQQTLKERFKLIQSKLLSNGSSSIIFYSCYFCNLHHHFLDCDKKFPNYHPQFNYQEDKPIRNCRSKKNTLILNKQMAVFKQIKNKDSFRLIMKVEGRLGKIKRKIDEKNKDFEIDVLHDWKIYYPQSNFSKIKQKWNY